MLATPIAKKTVRNLLVMEASLNKPRDYSQRISNEQPVRSAKKRQSHYDFASHNTSNNGASAEPKLKGSRRPFAS